MYVIERTLNTGHWANLNIPPMVVYLKTEKKKIKFKGYGFIKNSDKTNDGNATKL